MKTRITLKIIRSMLAVLMLLVLACKLDAQDDEPIQNPIPVIVEPVIAVEPTRFDDEFDSETSPTEDIQNAIWEREQQLNYQQFFADPEVAPDLDVMGTESRRLRAAEGVDAGTFQDQFPQPKLTLFGEPDFDVEEGVIPTSQDSAVWVQDFNVWLENRRERPSDYEKAAYYEPEDVDGILTYGEYQQRFPSRQENDIYFLGWRDEQSTQNQTARKGIDDEDKDYLERAASPTSTRRFASRLEIRELNLTDPEENQIYKASRGVFGIVMANQVTNLGEGKVQVDTSLKVGVSYGLCADEPYREQPSTCFCTAFLVAPDIVATAAHCIGAVNLNQIRLISGFELANKSGAVDYQITEADVFSPVEVVGGSEGQSLDFVLLRLNRQGALRHILPLSMSSAAPADSVYAIGYPSGLPMKVAGIGTVRETEGSTHFYSNIDTYEGNSGSPVFDARTHEVVGILIEGDQDFEQVGNCRRAKDCFGRGCKGEKAISAAQIRPFLQNAR